MLGASQVEYKPFGKPPLKREIPGNAGIPWRNPALNSPPKFDSDSFNTSAICAICVHIPAAPSRGTFTLPGSLLYALNCFNMSEYMSDEHVLGTPGAPPCRATCPASEPHASPPSHTDHTDHTVIRSDGGLALRIVLRLAGIEDSRAAPPARPACRACTKEFELKHIILQFLVVIRVIRGWYV